MTKCNITDTINFIRSTYNTKDSIHLHEPKFFGNERKYLLDAMDSTLVSQIGPYVDRFENDMSLVTGTKKAVAVTNGTCALQLALQSIGIKASPLEISIPAVKAASFPKFLDKSIITKLGKIFF